MLSCLCKHGQLQAESSCACTKQLRAHSQALHASSARSRHSSTTRVCKPLHMRASSAAESSSASPARRGAGLRKDGVHGAARWVRDHAAGARARVRHCAAALLWQQPRPGSGCEERWLHHGVAKFQLPAMGTSICVAGQLTPRSCWQMQPSCPACTGRLRPRSGRLTARTCILAGVDCAGRPPEARRSAKAMGSGCCTRGEAPAQAGTVWVWCGVCGGGAAPAATPKVKRWDFNASRLCKTSWRQ